MTPDNWIALVAVAFSVAGPLVAYGALRQKVGDLERRVSAVEGHDRAVIRLEVQVENLIALVRKLDDKLDQNQPAPPSRSRSVAK